MVEVKPDAGQVIAEEAAAFEEAFTAEFAGDNSSDEAGDKGDSLETKKAVEEQFSTEGEGEGIPEAKADAGKAEDGTAKEPEPAGVKDKATLKQTAEDAGTGQKIKLPSIAKHPDLKEGDYTRSSDGRYLVHSEHLGADIATIINDDAEEYIKIYKAKPEKAEAIAAIIGVKSDATRSAGRVFADVVTAMRNATPEQAKQLIATYWPARLDPNGAAPFELAYTQKEPVAQAPIVQQSEETLQEILTATYRVVAERAGHVKLDSVLDSSEVNDAFLSNITDTKGNPLSVYDRVALAVDKVFPKGVPAAETQDDANRVSAEASAVGTGAGGARGGSASGGAEAAEMAAFEATLRIQ